MTKKQDDHATIQRALEEAQGMEDPTPVLSLISGPVTVILPGWEWSAVALALDTLADNLPKGASETMEPDLRRLSGMIEKQAAPQVNAPSNADVAKRLRAAGYGL